jgi:hypothetical protein
MYNACTHTDADKWVQPDRRRYSPRKRELVIERRWRYRPRPEKGLRLPSVAASTGRLLSDVLQRQGRALEELLRIERDTAGDQSPRPESIETARRVLVSAAALSFPTARVQPLGDGGVMIRFWKGTRFVTVDVFDEGDVVGTAASRGSDTPAEVWQIAAGGNVIPVTEEIVSGLLRRLLDELG